MAVTAEEQQARYAFGSALAHVRASRGWSQTELRDHLVAHGFKVSVGGVGMWETGKSAPGVTAIRAIETALGAPGLGLVLGLDAGVLRQHDERITDLERRLAQLEGEGATSNEFVGELRVAAYEGGDAHQAPSPTDIRDRPRPPAVEPEVDPPGPDYD